MAKLTLDKYFLHTARLNTPLPPKQNDFKLVKMTALLPSALKSVQVQSRVITHVQIYSNIIVNKKKTYK